MIETCWAQSAVGFSFANETRIAELQGKAEVFLAGGAAWASAQTNQLLHPFDRLRTGANSRIALRWSGQSVISFGAMTELEILPPESADAQNGLHLIRGVISFFHRDKPGRIRVITRGAVAGVEGTEFVLAVNDTDQTTLSVIDGQVRFGNEQATLVLTNGQQAAAAPGEAPVRTAGFIANNLLQWCFYYPAVLDPDDLLFTPEEQKVLAESLAAYRAGDVLAALAKYSAASQPDSDAEHVYYAALLLSVGQVEQAETTLASLSGKDVAARPQRIAIALRRLIAAVKHQTAPSTLKPQLATEFLAESYYEQSRAVPETSLEAALHLTKQAATNSPQFGFAWERVAELEFSFGRTKNALAALDKSLALAPRNAQALALKGFLLAAQNQTREAIGWFDRAIAVDSALGNAWLGRGLSRIRRGDTAGGREDLLLAAALEPQRAELRNYLGKTYAQAGDYPHAVKELQLAKKLDPNDPTAWLYSALLNQERNQINDAIRDLEKSKVLNNNRSVYRSQFLLDQDQAVRSANLAAMYQDAGMDEVARREAARAVNYNYANYSAHLFLANSYNQLNDTKNVNFRYETPMNNEYLLANLLAPAAAGTLSPLTARQEYARLFESDRHFGLASDTEYLSRGAWTESGAQYGVYDNFSYALEAYYNYDPGQRPNNDYEARSLSLTARQQFTPQDSGYVQIQSVELNGGDTHQYYSPGSASPTFRFKESQEPNVILGYQHEWSPGVHTLFLAARLDDDFSYTNSTQPSILTFRPELTPGIPELTGVHNINMPAKFENQMAIYSAELQQIWETPEHNTIVGARVQYGKVETLNLQTPFVDPPPDNAAFDLTTNFIARQDYNNYFNRYILYGYHQWQMVDSMQLIGGLAYDWLRYPENAVTVPVSDQEATTDRLSPKAGLIWTPLQDTTIRFAYTRSLGGVSFDQSYQLEPSQVAGFIQSFRSIIPTSVSGEAPGACFESFGISLEQKFQPGTYLGLYGGILNSRLHRVLGAFDSLPDTYNFAVPSGLQQNLDYQEKTLQFTVNQLLGRDWAIGGQYRISQALLDEDYPGTPNDPVRNYNFTPHQRLEAILQQVRLFAVLNHPSGFFARGEALWNGQNNYSANLPDDYFWQFNAFVGWRFLQRKAEITVGLLNIGNQTYNLNPLNLHPELPQYRTLAMRLRLNF
ncbi:MAG: TonB-dependent receptor [Limisphaerales bacterium]